MSFRSLKVFSHLWLLKLLFWQKKQKVREINLSPMISNMQQEVHSVWLLPKQWWFLQVPPNIINTKPKRKSKLEHIKRGKREKQNKIKSWRKCLYIKIEYRTARLPAYLRNNWLSVLSLWSVLKQLIKESQKNKDRDANYWLDKMHNKQLNSKCSYPWHFICLGRIKC